MKNVFRHMGFLFLILAAAGCDTRALFDGPDSYSDGFESYTGADGLVDGSNSNWSFFQLTDGANSISVETNTVHTGLKSIRFQAAASTDGFVSKASINKKFMAFREGTTVYLEAWYFIAGSSSIDWLFIMDLEEKTAIGAGPGIRLAFENGFLLLEHKYPMPDIRQTVGQEIPFPRNEWVKVRLEAGLSQQNTGRIRVWQNGVLVLTKDNWQTLPVDILYFVQGTKGMYSQIEFGITANTRSGSVTLYLDDISVGVSGPL